MENVKAFYVYVLQTRDMDRFFWDLSAALRNALEKGRRDPLNPAEWAVLYEAVRGAFASRTRRHLACGLDETCRAESLPVIYNPPHRKITTRAPGGAYYLLEIPQHAEQFALSLARMAVHVFPGRLGKKRGDRQRLEEDLLLAARGVFSRYLLENAKCSSCPIRKSPGTDASREFIPRSAARLN